MFGSATLLGSSSGRNTGDAALISSIMQAVNASCESNLLYEIPTIRPSYIRNNYREKVKPVGMLPWNFSIKMLGIPTYRSIMRTDLTLIFDSPRRFFTEKRPGRGSERGWRPIQPEDVVPNIAAGHQEFA